MSMTKADILNGIIKDFIGERSRSDEEACEYMELVNELWELAEKNTYKNLED